MQAGPNVATALGGLLFDVWRLSGSATPETFQDAALAAVRTRIPFHGALWGYATARSTVLRVHAVRLVDVPPEAMTEYETVRELDPVVAAATLTPGRCIAFRDRPGNPRVPSPWVDFVRKWNLTGILTVMRIEERSRLAMFVSLYRNGKCAPFSPEERSLLELAAPHLAAAHGTVRLRGLAGAGGPRRPGAIAAVADTLGRLHFAEEGFEHLVHTEWPAWTGPALPEVLRPLVEGGGHFRGNRVVVEAEPARGGLGACWIRPVRPADDLSPRELEIARCWSEGLSAKDIAVRLDLSTTTVRNRIQDLYLKLDVHGRTGVMAALGAMPQAAPSDSPDPLADEGESSPG